MFKKTQSALEFMLILGFMFILLQFVMYFVGIYMIENQEHNHFKRASSFVEQINNELKILNQVEPGYYRELKFNVKDYYIKNITQSLLVLEDVYNNKTYYFDLIGNHNITFLNYTDVESGVEYQKIILSKNDKNDSSKFMEI